MRKIKLRMVQPLEQNSGFDYKWILARAAANKWEPEVDSDDMCPLCYFGMDLSQYGWRNFHDWLYADQRNFNIFSVYVCPHCHRGFVVVHKMAVLDEGDGVCVVKEESQAVYPHIVKLPDIDDAVHSISPKFYDIYQQCLTAKANGLYDLYGMGFRKAVEYLVTDFAIKMHPEENDKIISMSLHNRIEKYISDDDVKRTLLACRLLGNNEVHYNNNNTSADMILFGDLISGVISYIGRALRKVRVDEINKTKASRK